MASLVTIEKSHLETLMRRAECHGQPPIVEPPTDILTVTIPKPDHDDMLRRCREYENLKQALLQGGISQASLETLLQGPGSSQPNGSSNGNHDDDGSTVLNGHSTSPPSVEPDASRPATKALNPGNTWQKNRGRPAIVQGRAGHDAETDETSAPSDSKAHSPAPGGGRDSSSQQANNNDNHTVTLKNLPERVTHRDIVAAIHGGALVDVFLRSRDRTASITFADGKAASEYLAYAKRGNVYILGKLVDAAWSERQFHFPPYMAAQLANGASRNLVIRGVHPNLTEARIRADLDHIHNLVVIGITYAHGNSYIFTNSVQRASFARTCMKSRIPYNSMRVEYFPDECAEPLPKVPVVPCREPLQPVEKLNPMANRFQMLNIDGADDDSDEQEEITNCGPAAGGARWTNNVITV